MAAAPVVSLCIATYNAARYLKQTLATIAAQTYRDWELVVTDDCSTDDTFSLLQKTADDLGILQTRFYSNPQRLGMANNWNRVVELAGGRFVKLVGQDDLLKPDCLAAQVDALEKHSSVTVVTCTREVVDASGTPVLRRKCFRAEGVYNGRDTIRRSLLTGTNIIGEPVSVLFRADALRGGALFAPEVVYFTDLDLWLRFLGNGDLYFIAEPKTSFRIHKTSATRSLEREVAADFVRVIDRMEARGLCTLSPAAKAWIAVRVRALTLARQFAYRFLARG